MAQEINAKEITAADVEAGVTASWCFSDAYKEIHGFRPRHFTPEMEASFWNTFDAEWADMQAREAAELQAHSDHFGQEFKSFMEYYNFLDAQYERECQEAQEAEAAAKAEREEFFRRGSPVPIVEAWEHGDAA